MLETSSPSTGEDRGEGGLILPPHSNSLPPGEREPVSMHRSISKLFVELGLSIYLELREKHLRSSLRNWVFHRLVRLSLSVNVFSVANFYDVNQQLLVIDGVQDTIVPLSYPIPVEVTC